MAWRVREADGGGRKAVVELEGMVDSTNLEEFFALINSVFKRGVNRIVLDLENTSYLSSGGLSVIIDAYNRAAREGGKLVIARVSEMVLDIFRAVHFDQIVEFHASLEEALDSVGGREETPD